MPRMRVVPFVRKAGYCGPRVNRELSKSMINGFDMMAGIKQSEGLSALRGVCPSTQKGANIVSKRHYTDTA